MLDSDILDGFKEETTALIEELNGVIEKLERPAPTFPAALLEEFSQKIDRVMGAAKTILTMEPNLKGLKQVSTLAEICKALGYRASDAKMPQLIPFFAAFWADTLETIEELVQGLDAQGNSSVRAAQFAGPLQKRLEWLRSKLNPAQPAAPKPQVASGVTAAPKDQLVNEDDIDQLLAGLDL